MFNIGYQSAESDLQKNPVIICFVYKNCFTRRTITLSRSCVIFHVFLFVANFFLKSTFSKKIKKLFQLLSLLCYFHAFCCLLFFFFFFFSKSTFSKKYFKLLKLYKNLITFSLLVNFSYFSVVHFFAQNQLFQKIFQTTLQEP